MCVCVCVCVCVCACVCISPSLPSLASHRLDYLRPSQILRVTTLLRAIGATNRHLQLKNVVPEKVPSYSQGVKMGYFHFYKCYVKSMECTSLFVKIGISYWYSPW